MKHTIRGTTLPIVDIELNEGESVFTESGGMAWMSSNIDMNSNMKGGLGKAFGRMLTGESLFKVDYTCNNGTGVITFCSEFPGKVVKMSLANDRTIICQRDAFMVATSGINLEMQMVRKLGAGFFGGEGFFLQKISGEGTVCLEFAGEMTEYDLKEGQTLKVDPGYIGAYESTVDYDISRVKGIKNMLFGGEGLFLATVTGPGKVWLQSMPIRNLARKMAAYMPGKNHG